MSFKNYYFIYNVHLKLLVIVIICSIATCKLSEYFTTLRNIPQARMVEMGKRRPCCKSDWHHFLEMRSMIIRPKISSMHVAITFSFIYLAVYCCVLMFGSGILMYILYAGSPLVIVWVVVAVLKDKQEPQKTFKDYFYQDEEMRRLNNGKG
jgi:hypothetical protein